jgi:hypothetical protein
MTNFKKRSQSIIDEISENLKRTIKKYNEIDQDDVSVAGLSEYEKNPSEDLKEENLKRHNIPSNNNNNNKSSLNNLSEKESNANLYYPNKSDGSSIKNKVKKLLNDIDSVSSNLTKDFENLEELLEGIDKDLEIFNKN